MDHSYSGDNSWDHSSSGYSGQHQSSYDNSQSFQYKSGNSYNSYNQYKPPSNSGSSYGSSGTGQSAYNNYSRNQMIEQQQKYNEANTLQENQEKTEKYMQNDRLTTANANVGDTNWNGGNPYSSCCYDGGGDGGSSTGEALGAAALGAVGGMAIGSMMRSAAQPQAPTTTVIEIAPPYGYPPAEPPLGTTLYSLPPGAYPTTINGSTYEVAGSTCYKSYFNGSQVVYVATQPY